MQHFRENKVFLIIKILIPSNSIKLQSCNKWRHSKWSFYTKLKLLRAWTLKVKKWMKWSFRNWIALNQYWIRVYFCPFKKEMLNISTLLLKRCTLINRFVQISFFSEAPVNLTRRGTETQRRDKPKCLHTLTHESRGL